MQASEIKPAQDEQVYSVSRLNNEVRCLLEGTFVSVWVEGEISNFAAPHSGHWYFALKDATAQVRCAMFRGNQRKLGFVPKDGMHVLIKARVSLYENRGEFQLIAESMEERGEGKLQRAFEALKKKLEAAGLFDTARKKAFPRYPQQIGVVTSPTGAAIRDILNVLKRRYACASVIIYPTLVQGDAAAPAIVRAIQNANQRRECDVLILARGGGSLEDLWPFNEEMVAHAIYQSQLPIISGVGHEIDFTIADFVADLRAPTPSAAAEIITPDKAELLQIATRQQQQISQQIRRTFLNLKEKLSWMQKHLEQQHPKRRLLEQMQRLDNYELTLVQLQLRLLTKRQTVVKDLAFKLQQQIPSQHIQRFLNQLRLMQQKLHSLIIKQLTQQQAAVANLAGQLNALSPLATLQRGYALATKDQQILQDVSQVEEGDEIKVRLKQGAIDCVVEKIYTA